MDAADGAVNSGPLNEDLNKVLKKLGYPEIADNSKPSTLIDKAVQACTRRLKKLYEMLPTRENDSSETPDPTAASELQRKTGSQHAVFGVEAYTPYNHVLPLLPRMFGKIRDIYGRVDACCEVLQKFKAEGVLDGYSEQLLGY